MVKKPASCTTTGSMMTSVMILDSVLNSTQLEAQFNRVMTAANCSDIQCLQSISEEEFDDAQQKVLDQGGYTYGLFYYAPYADGTFVQNLPSIEMELGHIAPVPLLTSREGNEGHIFVPANVSTSAEVDIFAHDLFQVGLSFFGQLDQVFPLTLPAGPFAYNSSRQRAEWIMGNAFIQCVSQFAASAATNVQSVANRNPPVWKYLFAYPSNSTAYHGSYFPYVWTAHQFNATDKSPAAEIGRYVTRYWTAFFLHYDPNAVLNGTKPEVSWPRYGAGSQILYTGSDAQMTNMTDIDIGPPCQFYQAHPVNIAI